MIKVKKTDSLVDILRKMKEEKKEQIIIDFPFWHPILHNQWTLKILKAKAENKELIIATNDKTAKQIGKKLGIKYSLTNNPDVVKHNYTFWEYFLYTIRSSFRQLKDIITKTPKDNPFTKYHQRYSSSKIGFFVAFLVFSIFLLFFVFYFAVNKTYIYITPEIEVKTKGHNFIFKELPEEEIITDNNIIKLTKIEKTLSLSDTFGTSWVQEENVELAKGSVTLYNLTPEETIILRGSRLLTAEWIVFLLDHEVTIPAADLSWIQAQAWEVTVTVTARILDATQKITGENGNIPANTRMSLPGLYENKNKIYAINTEAFTWGTNDYTRILSEEDIENAKGILRSKLEKDGLKMIKDQITEENEKNNSVNEIFLANGALRYEDFNVTGLDGLTIGEELESFTIYGTLKVVAYTYNKDILVGKIHSIIKQTTLEKVEKILYIDQNSINVVHEIFRSTEDNFSTKQTVFADVFYVQNFDEKNQSYVDRIKGSISGKNIKEAEKILLNNPQISIAKIKVRPFFVDTVSKLNNNIEFIIEDTK